MTADIEITDDTIGDNYDITVDDFGESDNLANLSVFDTSLILKVRNLSGTEVLSKALTDQGNGVARWVIAAADYTNMPAGEYLAKIVGKGSSSTLIRETEPPMTMKVHTKFDA